MINHSLLQCLVHASGCSKKEVSSHLQDLAYTCFTKMDEGGKHSSWTKAHYPGLNVYLRIGVEREGYNYYPKKEFKKGEIKGTAKIKLWEDNVHFSSKQVEEFLVEKILLGAK